MKRIRWFKNFGSFRSISVFGSILTPLINGRFIPHPYLMSWVVTRRCNSRCQMCTIWQEKGSDDLNLDQIEHIFRKNNFSFIRTLTLTGGEPTLRSDLPQLLKIASKNMVNLEHILLATSGLNSQRTLAHVNTMMSYVSKKDKIYRFDVQVSLDGIKQVHDGIRGIDGFFNKVDQTIQGLLKLKKQYAKLSIRFSSVLMPQNIAEAIDILKYSNELDIPITFSPVILSSEYYKNLTAINNLTFNSQQKIKEAQSFFKMLSNIDQSSLRFYYKDMIGMIDGSQRKRTCMMGYFGFILEHNGDIFPCVNCEQDSMGNLLTNEFEKIWFENTSNKIRKNLRRDCCPNCPSLCFSPPSNLIELMDVAIRKIV